MESPSWMSCQPGADLRLLMGRIVIEDDVDGLILRQFRLNRVEEPDEFLMPMTLHVATDHRAVENIEGGKQGRGSMALIIMGHRPTTALLQRKPRLCTVQRLDLAFLIDGKDNGMGWRGDVVPDDVMQLLGKGLVIR